MSHPAPPPGARLMLILPLTGSLTPAHATACATAGDVAAVILTPTAAPLDPATLRALAAPLQALDCAVVLAADAAPAAAAGLDGVHVGTPATLAATLKALKPEAIVGAGGLESRHEAMEAGESGADYVLFGDLDGAPASLPRTRDMVVWWTELFEIPCVGVAADLEAVATLAAAGADFIALAAPLTGADDAPAQIRAAQDIVAAQDIIAADGADRAP